MSAWTVRQLRDALAEFPGEATVEIDVPIDDGPDSDIYLVGAADNGYRIAGGDGVPELVVTAHDRVVLQAFRPLDRPDAAHE